MMQRVTADVGANDQLLYFTSPSLTEGGETLVFISDRGGAVNLWSRDLATGEERQISRNTGGVLRSYVYFGGQPFNGLGKASVCLDPVRRRLFYLQGRLVMRVDLDDPRPRAIAELPDDQVTAFTHVSHDGRLLCVPTTDARALDGYPGYDIDARVRAEKLSSYLRVFDTATGDMTACERVPAAWVTHVQFRPNHCDQILYNHEWASDKGIRRMWLWDGRSHRPLRDENAGRSRRDWACHEMWTRDGSAVIYHGGYENGPTFLGRVSPDHGAIVEIPFDPSYRPYGHFTVGPTGTLISDGYYVAPTDPPPPEKSCGRHLSLVHPDWHRRTLTWTPLCQHGSTWKTQDEHPHPVFNAAGDWAYFTSDVSGKRAVWRVATGELAICIG